MQLEKDIERRLVREVRKRGGWCLKWVCPGWAGVPDRIVLLPGGDIVFVELKRPGGRLGPLQRAWAKRLIRLGCVYWDIWSMDDVELFCDAVLNDYAEKGEI